MLDNCNLLLSFFGNFFAMVRRDELQRVAGSLIKSVNHRNIDNFKNLLELITCPGPRTVNLLNVDDRSLKFLHFEFYKKGGI